MQSLVYWSEKLPKTQPRMLKLVYQINGAKDATEVVPGGAALVGFDAITQAAINAHLGTSSEFTTAQFDATSMGTNAFGGVINMAGQCQRVVYMDARFVDTTEQDSEIVKVSDSLTDSTLQTEVAAGANGNIGFKAELTGVDAATSGMIIIDIAWISK